MAKKASQSKRGPASAVTGIEEVFRIGKLEFKTRDEAAAHLTSLLAASATSSLVSAVMQVTAARKRGEVKAGVEHVVAQLMARPDLANKFIAAVSAATPETHPVPTKRIPKAAVEAPAPVKAPTKRTPKAAVEAPAPVVAKVKKTRQKKAEVVLDPAFPDLSSLPPPPPPPPAS